MRTRRRHHTRLPRVTSRKDLASGYLAIASCGPFLSALGCILEGTESREHVISLARKGKAGVDVIRLRPIGRRSRTYPKKRRPSSKSQRFASAYSLRKERHAKPPSVRCTGSPHRGLWG